MSEPDCISRAAIPEHQILSRLAQSEQMREFFIQMWIQNPALARQGGIKVQSLLSPLAVVNAEERNSDLAIRELVTPLEPRKKRSIGFTSDIEEDGE